MLSGSYMAPRYNPALPPNSHANRGWLTEAIQEGESFLRNNLAYSDIDRAISILCGAVEEKLPRKLSNISSNRAKRNIREMVAILSNLRPFWGYETGDRTYDGQAETYNKLMQSWFFDCFVDQSIKEVLQYAAGVGTGYALVEWNPYYHPNGQGDIEIRAKSPKDVLPIQLPESKNIQHAYSVVIREETPITLAWSRWPEFQHLIKPDRFDTKRGSVSKYPFHSLITGAMSRLKGQTTRSSPWPVVDIYSAYINDVSHNDTGSPMIVGGGSRGPTYTVPSIGSTLLDGRIATAQDAMLFPQRRLMIGTNTCIMYDGPSFWIHGMAPLSQFSCDQWVFEFLGFSLVKDVASIQRSRNSVMRGVDDQVNLVLRPPLVWDKNSVDKTKAERFDPRQPGQSIMADFQLTGGDVVKPILPAGYSNIPNFVPAWIDYLDRLQDWMQGTPALQEIQKLNQIPESSTIDKLTEMSGSIAQDMARSMERSMRSVAQMALANFIQFYTLPRRLKILGRDGITPEDLDTDPGKMIPDEPGYDLLQRQRRHYQRFTYRITPNSLTQMQAMTTKLLYLQLSKAGFPISPWDIAKVLDIPNFGPFPEGTNNMIERWEYWQKMQLELQIQAQQMVAQSQPPDPNNPMAAIAQALNGGGGGKGGRPSSWEEAPKMESRPDRTTVTTS
jgi:hypothetical protein